MGYGTWTTTSYNAALSSKGFTNTAAVRSANVQEVYRSYELDPMLNIKGKVRECADSEEHPETLPIILALDVTGSMGDAAKACAAQLDDIMSELYGKVKDVEFCMLGIGDMNYDDAPIQATQFESDVRIFDQTTKIYFEGGGGGNRSESYTAAWWFGLHHAKLDCWKRGKKGIIITMGDEALNPVLYGYQLRNFFGDTSEDVDTNELYKEVCEKYDVYHIAITNESCYYRYEELIKESFGKLLKQHLIIATSDELPKVISDIVDDHVNNTFDNFITSDAGATVTDDGIVW